MIRKAFYQGKDFSLFLPSTFFLCGFRKRIFFPCQLEEFIILLIELMIMIIAQRVLAREIPENELQFDDYFASDTIHLKAIFSESEKYRLIEEYGVHCYSVTDNGKLLLERDFTSYNNMRSWIFSFGDKVTILEPKQLCDDRKKQAAAILKMKG